MNKAAALIAAIVGSVLLGHATLADAPRTSPLPIPRPAAVPVAPVEAAQTIASIAPAVQAQKRLLPLRRHAPAQKLGAEGIAAEALAAVSVAPAPSNAATIAPAPVPSVAPRVPVNYNAAIRPIRRSEGLAPETAAFRDEPTSEEQADALTRSAGLATSPPVYRTRVPLKRPRGLKTPARPRVVQAAATTRIKPNTAPVTQGRQGRVCGDRRIKGRTMSPISGRLAGCGIARPVLVSEVSGVTLSRPATIDCDTAKSLADWVDRGVKPAIGRYGGGVRQLDVVASYSCRTRNNKKGAKLSEHAKGKAVDVAGFKLKNGSTITVLQGWRERREGKILKKIHKAACGPFGTVLGPNADRYHQDHFHMDTARYRSGAYCR